jgi:hypothetical protein
MLREQVRRRKYVRRKRIWGNEKGEMRKEKCLAGW